jgi:hypothetical protein
VIIIWGIRRRLANLAMLTLACRHGHVAAHRLVRVSRWFTLFFVPIAPAGRYYFSVCAHCGLQVRWGKEEAEAAARAAVASAPAGGPPAADPIAPPLSSSQVFSGVLGPPSAPPAGWYRDPSGCGGQRYWDGVGWTDHVTP